ncbi:hypothetical protein JG687_00004994 [Phytophthora cactorum]|uniref:Uncharacterized protein n=1 Tax=Phytophthora cactorum TaxID=29920 RepID=A0A8T1UM56_9STRA|nr:hypothetical protein JG687_00004994 [Phytophthora cactorum]
MDVSEVLTLLDTIDSNENDSRSVISLEFESEFGHDAVPNVSPQQPQLKSKKDRRRKEGPVRYTTNLQRRKKAELKALREEARQLNAQLEGLLLSRLSHIGMVPAITPQDQNPGVWRSLAIIESEGRERAERANRELKSIVANQVKVHASIRKILGRNDLLQGMDFVFEAQPTSDRLLQQFDFSDAILAELSSGLGRLPENDWQAKAEAMKQQRLEAELLNMTLRRTLAKEQKVAKSLRTIMDKRPFMPRSVKYDMRRASCSQTETRTQISQCTQCCNPTTSHINPTGVRREIEATLQRMHVQTNALLNATAADDSLSFNFNIRLDPAAGPTIEVTTTTPMNCTLDHTVKLLGPKYQGQPRRHGGNAHEQQFNVELGAPYQTVWALCFRACTWLAVRQPPSDPVNESVIRSHYSVAAEKAVGCTVIDGEHIDSVRDRALRAMGKQIKERYMYMYTEMVQGGD